MKLDLTSHWTPTQAEFDAFAAVSGDDNPIHVDPAFSARTAFGRTVSHGMLIYTRLWGQIINAAPAARQLSQSMMFPNPAFADQPVILSISGNVPGRLEVVARRAGDGAQVLVGETEVAA